MSNRSFSATLVLVVLAAACHGKARADDEFIAPACQPIQLSFLDAFRDLDTQMEHNGQLFVIQTGCTYGRWSAPVIACFADLARNLPATDPEKERCLAMLTPAQERYLKLHGVDLFLSPRRWQAQAKAELAAPPRLQLADLVGDWIYNDRDPIEGETRFQVAADGQFRWTYSPMHDGGCETIGQATIWPTPDTDETVLGNLAVVGARDTCHGLSTRVWSVRGLDARALTLVEELGNGRNPRVFHRR